jgi:tRNA-dihydrouridine synthase B
MHVFSDTGLLFPRLMLAPLSGITSLPFRLINRQAGCRFAFLEMICARSLSYNSKKTVQMMASAHEDRPLGVQLLGNDQYYILKALENIKDYPYDILDLNAACPHKKVTKIGKGAALLKDTKKLSELLEAIVKEVKKPVTVKLRLGWSDAECAADIAKSAQDSGVYAVCVHGRTRQQCYTGPVDYASIRKVKKALSIPVIGSGDIWNASFAKKMFDETGCDAVIVARWALGNPWIFSEIEEFLSSGKLLPKPSTKVVGEMMKRHLRLFVDFYGEEPGTMRFRKFFIWYTRGFAHIKPLRMRASVAKNISQMERLIDRFIVEAKATSITG